MLTPILVKTEGEQFVAYFDPSEVEPQADGSISVRAVRYPAATAAPRR